MLKAPPQHWSRVKRVKRVKCVKPGSKHEVCPCGGAAKTAACSRGPVQSDIMWYHATSCVPCIAMWHNMNHMCTHETRWGKVRYARFVGSTGPISSYINRSGHVMPSSCSNCSPGRLGCPEDSCRRIGPEDPVEGSRSSFPAGAVPRQGWQGSCVRVMKF